MSPPHFRSLRSRHRSRGQSLAEFALVFPILMLILGGIIQFGIIFWGQNTLTQVARDTGRWASTQTTCPTSASVLSTANSIAGQSSLIGYTAGSWTTTNVVVSLSGDPCPVTSNAQVAFVTVRITHRVPIFFPMVPGDGNLTTSAQFRMEPNP
jgi:Flp pilus assembly protein TadG